MDPVLLYTRTRQGNTLADRVCPVCGDPVWRHANAPQDCAAAFDALEAEFPVNALLRRMEAPRG